MGIETFKINANLQITGNAYKSMMDFTRVTEKASLATRSLEKNLKELNLYFSSINTKANSINPKLSQMVSRFSNLGIETRSTSRSFEKFSRELKVAEHSTSALNTKTAMLERNLRSLSVAGRQAGASTMGGKVGHAFGHGLGLPLRGIGLAPMAALGAGMQVIHSYKEGTAYQQEANQLDAQNIPGLSKADAMRFVNSSKRKSGISKHDLLTALNDAATITKDKKNAMALAPTVAEMGYLGKVYFGHGDYKMSNVQLQSAIKVAEIVSGSQDAKVLKPYIEQQFKSILSTSGRVNPSTFLAVTRNSGGRTKGMDPNFFFYGLEPMIQEYGVKVGKMLKGFYRHMDSGRMTTAAAELMSSWGLAKPGSIKYFKNGHVKNIDPGGIKGQDLRDRNPYAWIDKFLFPAMNKAGYTTASKKTSALGKVFTDEDLTFVLTYLQQKEKIQQNFSANKKTKGMSQLRAESVDQNAAAMTQFKAAFSDFSLALSRFSTPAINAGLKAAAFGLNKIADALNKFASLPTFFQLASHKKHDPSFGERFKSITGIDFSKSHSSEKPITIVSHVHIGGEKVGTAVAKSLAKSMNLQYSLGSSGWNSARMGSNLEIGSGAMGALP